MFRRFLAASIFAALLSVHGVLGGDSIITSWNELALRAVGYSKITPPEASRLLAMVHLAIWESVHAVNESNRVNEVQIPLEAATISAAYHSLRLLFPQSAQSFDTHFMVAEAMLPRSAATTNGLNVGHGKAIEILRRRDMDGSGVSVRYEEVHRPGYWIRTPVGYEKPLLPHWGKVKPFLLPAPDFFRPPPPPSLESAAWVADFNEVKRLGATNSTIRTPQQREIARFWADGLGTDTPPGHWNHIAQQVIRARGYDLASSARLMAALNLALADACIATWDAKYAYNFWCPVTAIRAAETDGNPGTESDPKWVPLLSTPPFPEYVSGHSAFSAAAATVLAEFTGADEFAFLTTSEGLTGGVRRYTRFSDAAKEAGMSRIYGGIHFRAGNEAGQDLGRKVGHYVMSQGFKEATGGKVYPKVGNGASGQ